MGDDALSPSLAGLVQEAQALYKRHYGEEEESTTWTTVAPGRVNLIGEHTDYTGGFVLPLAIDNSTVVYGTGTIRPNESVTKCRFVSTKDPEKPQECTLTRDSTSSQSDTNWTWYVMGVVAQYLPDLPDHNASFDVKLAVAGNVPLGGGLSSSASLEVSVARFLECVLGDDQAFSSSTDGSLASKTRALRCQKAENEWCHSPCGIMDQYVSSAASEGTLLLIDCTSLEYTKVKMAKTRHQPVLVVTNSNVSHDIAGGEYPIRVAQCQTATRALQTVRDQIKTLRDATMKDVQAAKEIMDNVSYRRARHVVSENVRTLEAKACLEKGDWNKVGALMNASHASMRDDYEVSCLEIDVLVNLAQSFPGVYGSRLTGGGFGGCTVTLVQPQQVEAFMDHLKREYKAKTGNECECFETSPGNGARVLLDGKTGP